MAEETSQNPVLRFAVRRRPVLGDTCGGLARCLQRTPPRLDNRTALTHYLNDTVRRPQVTGTLNNSAGTENGPPSPQRQ